ncbi:hypothetical protein V1478_002287 [Vespula squamosa]|uniref:Uncharacterized protein n=1 Tax=Vespula squamosa TaxID=30214 RepID=A0ABD2BXC7_VESSQ
MNAYWRKMEERGIEGDGVKRVNEGVDSSVPQPIPHRRSCGLELKNHRPERYKRTYMWERIETHTRNLSRLFPGIWLRVSGSVRSNGARLPVNINNIRIISNADSISDTRQNFHPNNGRSRKAISRLVAIERMEGRVGGKKSNRTERIPESKNRIELKESDRNL